MLISEISIRGLRSFSHNIQRVSLDTDAGKLCLLIGKNGAGKSSFISAFDFTIYGKTRGRNRKTVSKNALINRINKELATSIKFHSHEKDIEIERGINPDRFIIRIDGVEPVDLDPKKYDALIEHYVGMDMLSFRSFISLSVNDFKNFISLTTDEKQLLLDKLFNLQSVTAMMDIVSALNKANVASMAVYKQEITALELSITNIQQAMERMKEPKEPVVDHTDEIKSLEDKLDKYNPILEELAKKRDFLESAKEALKKEGGEVKALIDALDLDLNGVKRELSLFQASKCPTCESDFNSEHFMDLKETLQVRKDALDQTRKTLMEDFEVLKTKKAKHDTIDKNLTISEKTAASDLKAIKKKLNFLHQDVIKEPEVDLSEFESSIKDSQGKIKEIKTKGASLSEKNKCYAELKRLFGPDGIRRTIISSIVDPLNEYIQASMDIIDLPFRVRVDDSFNVTITQMSEVIEEDTLSTGESKLVNIAILLGYLKLIRTKRNINVLFLDEIFSSVDVENVDILLELLSNFAKEYKMNLFVVHHSIISERFFDRIIRLEKNTFTSIIEEK